MKRILSFSLILVLIISAAAGCTSINESMSASVPRDNTKNAAAKDSSSDSADHGSDTAVDQNTAGAAGVSQSGPVTSSDSSSDTPDNAEISDSSGSSDSSAPDMQGTETDTVRAYTEMPAFLPAGSFYSEDVNLCIMTDSERTGTVHYTMDGTDPTEASPVFENFITLEASDGDSPNIYCVRAVVYFDDGDVSEIKTNTFFVGSHVRTRYSTIVFSLITDPANLYDVKTGILADNNMYGHGEKYERPVYVQVFKKDGSIVFEQDAGVRMIGGDSRAYPYSSLKLFARKKYTPDRGYFPFDLFNSPRYDKEERIVEKYGKLVLRNNGDDSQCALMRDALCQRLAKNAGFENYEACLPAVVYLNGEYYALTWLHESYCDEYFRRKYGKNDGEFVIIGAGDSKKWYDSTSTSLEMKAVNEFNAIYKKYAYTDLTDDDNYNALCELIDIEDYLKYFAFELYVANTDWPDNNLECYRYYPDDDRTYMDGVFDGRWRFLIHDTDYSSGIYSGSNGSNAYDRDTWTMVSTKGNRHYAPLFVALMKRQDCREFFISYNEELISGALSAETAAVSIDALKRQRDGELKYHFELLEKLKEMYRKGETDYPIYATPSSVEKAVEELKEFYAKRPEYAMKYINNLYGR